MKYGIILNRFRPLFLYVSLASPTTLWNCEKQLASINSMTLLYGNKNPSREEIWVDCSINIFT